LHAVAVRPAIRESTQTPRAVCRLCVIMSSLWSTESCLP